MIAKMKTDWIKHVSLALTMALGLVSCNGSVNLAEGGIGGSGISMGTVSSIGSIWVNGVEYDTTGATIILADEPRQFTDTTGTAGGDTLLPGMVVTVRGSVNADGVSGQADSVTYADSLEGPIAAVVNANTFQVLGQIVIVDNLTKDERENLWNDTSSFVAGEVVEVSGFVDANGDIRATYIEKKPTSAALEIKGVVTSVTTPTTFAIGALTVDTSAISFDTGELRAGSSFVEVEGSGFDTAGALIASSVEVGSASLSTEDHDEAEMEGIVTSADPAASTFVLGGQAVDYTVDTAFNGGMATDIVPGVKVEVEGSLSGGILIANEITFEDGIELEANIHSIVGNTITLDGLVTFGGLNLEVIVDDVLTEFEGVAFTALQVGDHVELRARDTGSGLLATRLSASSGSDPNTVVLQGPLLAKDRNANSVTVLGVTVDGFTVFEIDSIGNVDATIFYDTVALDDLVSLEGTWDGVTLSGDKIELDD